MARAQEQQVAGFGFPLLDDITGGMEVGDLVAVVGATGTGKSSWSRYLVSVWQRHGLTLWLIDSQLHQATSRLLLDALAVGVSPRNWRLDRLDDQQQETMATWADTPGKTTVVVRNDAATAVRELQDLERQPGASNDGRQFPDLVVVDELSGLANPLDGVATSAALQALKGIAVRSGVPVLVTMTAPRESDARTTSLEILGPFADKIILTDGLLPARHGKPQITLVKNRKVGAITSSIEIGMTWSAELQTYRQS